MYNCFGVLVETRIEAIEQFAASVSRNRKGYCCFVDANVLAEAALNEDYREILNSSIMNACDGSNVALLARQVYSMSFEVYPGPEFFGKYILKQKQHIILGGSRESFERVKFKVERINGYAGNIDFIDLPFKRVEDFDYPGIAKDVNKYKPDFIWIALGAPKQEIFMATILPLIDGGIMMGIGAAVGYFSGDLKLYPKWAARNNLIWLFRLYQEFPKQSVRLLKIVRHLSFVVLKEYYSLRIKSGKNKMEISKSEKSKKYTGN